MPEPEIDMKKFVDEAYGYLAEMDEVIGTITILEKNDGHIYWSSDGILDGDNLRCLEHLTTIRCLLLDVVEEGDGDDDDEDDDE